MSETGWHEFLKADGLDDWVVLHGGPTAVFTTADIKHAAKLAAAIAELPGMDGDWAHISIVAKRLTVRLTREIWNIETSHIELAREISKVAATTGAQADTGLVQEVQIAIAETYGEQAQSTKYQLGLRFWIIPQRVQVDTTLGNAADAGKGRRAE